jgi:hypothetical protein
MQKLTVCLLALALTGACYAAEWELGGMGGLMWYKNVTVTQGSASASAGFKPGLGAGAFVTQNSSGRLGGQLRYLMGFSDMKLSSGGTETTFSAQTHTITYEILYYANKRIAKVRPYLAGGGGVKFYRGTGKEVASQPLGQFAILTKTQQTTGIISVGGGVKGQIGKRAFVYFEVRDYFGPSPKDVIAPVPPGKLSGWMHDITPMVGISIGF